MPGMPGNAEADDPASLERLFGAVEGLLPLWITEPYLSLDPGVMATLESRAQVGWFGYEVWPSIS